MGGGREGGSGRVGGRGGGVREGRGEGQGGRVGVGGRRNGKLGTTSEGFPQYNKSGSVRHECEMQGVMTS